MKRLFEDTIKKITGCIGVIDVCQSGNGSFMAKFNSTTECLIVCSDEKSNEAEAKVSCMFKTLKYLEENGRCEIFDLYYRIWKSMLFEIERFDEKTNMILAYGLYFKSAIESGFREFHEK